MEKRLNNKVDNYFTKFKDDIRNKIMHIDLNEKKNIPILLEYIYDYDRLCIDKEDFIKRKRVKNSIPENNRCLAKRANNEQCTRRRKNGCDFCGTHSKGTPHGLIDSIDDNSNKQQVIEVFAKEIHGIVYYLDNYNNVYKTEEIMQSKENPTVIAKYEKKNEKYIIPSMGLT